MKKSSAAARSSSKARRFDSREQEAFLNLWRTYDLLKALEEEMFERFQLSAQQYNALRLLRSVYPGSLPTQVLGTRLISRAPDMTRLLDKLEQRGLLSRERRADNRRIVDVSITEQGLKLLDEMDEPVRDCHRRQLGHMNATQLRELVALLQQVREPHEDAENLSFVDE